MSAIGDIASGVGQIATAGMKMPGGDVPDFVNKDLLENPPNLNLTSSNFKL